MCTRLSLPHAIAASNSTASERTGYIALFFSSPRDRRDLHSFPTRRSSDLGALCRGTSLFPSRARRADLPGLGLKKARDRKSTRLNSSHVAISYAVFCLKKKKRWERRRTHRQASSTTGLS